MIIPLEHKLEEIKKFSSFCFLLYVLAFQTLQKFHLARKKSFPLFLLPKTHKKICIRNLEAFFAAKKRSSLVYIENAFTSFSTFPFLSPYCSSKVIKIEF